MDVAVKVADGDLEKISSMMSEFRSSASPFAHTAQVIDYSSWIAVRPAGTDPKIKIDYSIKSIDKETAEK